MGEEVSKAEEVVPVTELPFDQRLQNVKFDLAASTLLSSTNALERMRVVLKQIYDRRTPLTVDPNDNELSALFSDAWSIIYSLDLLRRVLGPKLKEFADGTNLSNLSQLLSTVRAIRNDLEHTDDKRIAEKIKKADYPILGIITATFLEPSQLVDGKVKVLDHIVLSHSMFHQRINLNLELLFDYVQPIRFPVDHVRLFAFGKVIDLSQLVTLAAGATNVLAVRQLRPPDSNSRLRIVLTQTFRAS